MTPVNIKFFLVGIVFCTPTACKKNSLLQVKDYTLNAVVFQLHNCYLITDRKMTERKTKQTKMRERNEKRKTEAFKQVRQNENFAKLLN